MNKTDVLLQMMQQPKSYTDDEWKEILADDECRQLYTLMAKTKSAIDGARADEEVTDETIDAEWKRLGDEEIRVKREDFPLLRYAAMFVGILMLSGIAFAAIHFVRSYQQPQVPQETDTTAVAISSRYTHPSSLPKDTIPMEAVLYDNVPLEQMLAELSKYYNIKVEYRAEAARKIRLFYQWKPDYTMEKVVGMLNNFNLLQLELEGDTLFVASTTNPQP